MNSLKLCAAVALIGLCSACNTDSTGTIQVLTASDQGAIDLPFSDAVVAGGLIFVAGQIGAEPGSMNLVPGGIAAETRQALANIRSTLERLGASMDDVAKCTVFMNDMAQWNAMNAAYVEFFPNHKPARSALGVNGLALGASVEIECIAAGPAR